MAGLSFFKVPSLSPSSPPFEHRLASLALFSNCDLLIVIGMERVRKREERGVAAFFPTLPLVFSPPSRISSDPFAAIDFASKRYLSPDRAQRCNEARQSVARSLDFEISLQ